MCCVIPDTYGRIPTSEQFEDVVDELMTNVLQQLLNGHKLGSDSTTKVNFLTAILNINKPDAAWTSFVAALNAPIFKSLSEPTKLLPPNRYEEAQKWLFHFLDSDETMVSLCNLLKSLSNDLEISDSLARRLVFRMALLTLDQVQVFIAKEMRVEGAESDNEEIDLSSSVMTTVEKEEFKRNIGSLLRSFLFKGLSKQSESKMWRSISRCLKEKFVLGAVTTQQCLDKNLWFCESDDVETSITISEMAVEFFLIVESAVQLKESNSFLSLEETIVIVEGNRKAMEIWFTLTHNYFGDENSVYVMKLFIRSYRDLSIRLVESQRKASLKTKASVALRTNLKRD